MGIPMWCTWELGSWRGSVPLILCWCRSGRVLASAPLSLLLSLLQLCLALNAVVLLPGFPLCSFGFTLLGSNFQSVFGCLSKAPRCPIFTENQWDLAIKCFHPSLLKMSPINNKTKAKTLCEPRVCKLTLPVGLAPRSQKVRKATSHSNELN